MNDELERLYGEYWLGLTDAVAHLKSKAASPLLIKVDDEYKKADIRVVVFGQETDGWHGCFNESQKSVKELMERYFDYFYKVSEGGRGRGKRPFWNKSNFEFFERGLKEYFADKNVAFLWNNISKIGNAGRGSPNKDIKQLERMNFRVIEREVGILKPDVVIFTTGKRDGHIKFHFGEDTEFVPKLYDKNAMPLQKTINLIAQVKLQNFPNIVAVRVEHPNRRTLDNSLIMDVIKECWEG